MSSTPLRIGVMGCAGIARRRMLPAMAAEPGTEVVAVASRDDERARAAAREFGCRPVTGYDELLAVPEVEAVYVPLPVTLHADWAERALRSGRHVLAEKPLTTSPERTRELFALAERLGLVLMENVMFVHHAQHAEVRRLLADGAIGRPRALAASFAVPGFAPGDIRYRPDLGGGALFDIGVYPVRAALHLLGPRWKVVGSMLHRAPGHQVDTSGAALLATPEGVAAQLTFGMEHEYRSAYELWGTEGRLRVEPAFTPAADHRPTLELIRGGKVERLRAAADDQVRNTVRAFADAVRAAPAPAPGRADCVRQAELLAEIRHAAAARSAGG